jgi:hypothetical protein
MSYLYFTWRWQVCVETILNYGIHRASLYPLNRSASTLQINELTGGPPDLVQQFLYRLKSDACPKFDIGYIARLSQWEEGGNFLFK